MDDHHFSYITKFEGKEPYYTILCTLGLAHQLQFGSAVATP
jgi:hypothetical protein